MGKVFNEAVSKEQFRRIADLVPAIVALYSVKSGQYLYVNQAMKRVLGYDPEEWTRGGLSFAVALIHPDDVQPLLAKNQKALHKVNAQTEGGSEFVRSFEYRLRHKNGEYLWVRTDGTVFGWDEDGSVDLILNVTMDINEHKRTLSQLQHSYSALEEVMKIH